MEDTLGLVLDEDEAQEFEHILENAQYQFVFSLVSRKKNKWTSTFRVVMILS